MIILLRYYPKQKLIQDQSARFGTQTREIFHEKITSSIVLLGIAGVTTLVGVISSPVVSIIGWCYQLFKIGVVTYNSLGCFNSKNN